MNKNNKVYIQIKGYVKKDVNEVAQEYCDRYKYEVWCNRIYRDFDLFKWKWIYTINLHIKR